MPTQHQQYERKILLRKHLLKRLDNVEGTAYVPFIGDADIAHDLYTKPQKRFTPDLKIWGADIDQQRVQTAQNRLDKKHRIIKADCNQYPFNRVPENGFKVADFDAYNYPYQSFNAWWNRCADHQPDQFMAIFTDGQTRAINAHGKYRHPDNPDTYTELNGLKQKRKTTSRYFPRILKPWLEQKLEDKGYTLKKKAFYKRGPNMIYWGAIAWRTSRT